MYTCQRAPLKNTSHGISGFGREKKKNHKGERRQKRSSLSNLPKQADVETVKVQKETNLFFPPLISAESNCETCVCARVQACIHTHVSLYLDATLNTPRVETLQLESSCCKTSTRWDFYRMLSSFLLSASLWQHHSALTSMPMGALLLQLKCKLVFSK